MCAPVSDPVSALSTTGSVRSYSFLPSILAVAGVRPALQEQCRFSMLSLRGPFGLRTTSRVFTRAMSRVIIARVTLVFPLVAAGLIREPN